MAQATKNSRDVYERIVEGVTLARLEADNFTEMHHAVGSINGLLELLEIVTEYLRDGGDELANVNWSTIHGAVAAANRQCSNVYGVTARLMVLEEDDGLAEVALERGKQRAAAAKMALAERQS